MAMIMAVSGAQGTGKSTLINAVGASNPKVYVDEFKVSRTVQERLGYKQLSEAYATVDRMVEFQEAIIQAKINREQVIRNAIFLPYIITERSFLDIAAYTRAWIAKLAVQEKDDKATNELYDWYYESYLPRCIDYQEIYRHVLYISPHTDLEFEHDPNRADKDDQENIDFSMRQMLEIWKPSASYYVHYMHNDLDIGARVEFVNNIFKTSSEWEPQK